MRAVKVVSHTDYLTVSYERVKLPSELGFLDGGLFGAKKERRPIAHYDQSWELRCGAIFNTSDDHKQGSRLDLGGQALQFCRDCGLTDANILMIVSDSELKKHTTRLDYCWTIQDAGSVRHTVNHWFAGKAVSTFRKNPKGFLEHGSRKGATVMFGSKDSDQRVRVYDKAAEMGLLNEALLRVELQTRGEYASALVSDAYNSSVRTAARSRLLGVLDFPHLAWWKRAIHGDVIETAKIPKRDSKWQTWMKGQVKTSIQQHLAENDASDREFMRNWLIEMVALFNSGE